MVTVSGAHLSRIALSFGTLDMMRFERYDHAFPRHAHEEFTVGVFETGNGSIGYRRTKWRAFDGSVLAVPPDEVHAAEPLPASGWTYRAFYPSVPMVAAALGDDRMRAPPHFAQPIYDDPVLARRLLDIHVRLEGRQDRHESLADETRLLASIRSLVACHASHPPAQPPARSNTRAVRAAREYLRAHFSEDLKLATLAQACDTSPFHLVRSFTNVVGMPPHAYLTQIRANRARDRLVRGETPAAVAAACGFCDQSHLTRIFRRIFGVTPGDYVVALRQHPCTRGRGRKNLQSG
ncbi:MAG TPA: AraC family transcriptional regulator [Gemmatimonadaceae bacterium]|nr:AraC family transcriptional regulator [Gemmatimonadaceae bacterium]